MASERELKEAFEEALGQHTLGSSMRRGIFECFKQFNCFRTLFLFSGTDKLTLDRSEKDAIVWHSDLNVLYGLFENNES